MIRLCNSWMKLINGQMVIKFCILVSGPQRINPTNFGDTMTFPLVSPSGSYFLDFSKKYLNNICMHCRFSTDVHGPHDDES